MQQAPEASHTLGEPQPGESAPDWAPPASLKALRENFIPDDTAARVWANYGAGGVSAKDALLPLAELTSCQPPLDAGAALALAFASKSKQTEKLGDLVLALLHIDRVAGNGLAAAKAAGALAKTSGRRSTMVDTGFVARFFVPGKGPVAVPFHPGTAAINPRPSAGCRPRSVADAAAAAAAAAGQVLLNKKRKRDSTTIWKEHPELKKEGASGAGRSIRSIRRKEQQEHLFIRSDKSSTGFKGVYPDKSRYTARCDTSPCHFNHLGSFGTPEEAAQAYLKHHQHSHSHYPATDTWFQCDDCNKWRRFAAAAAHTMPDLSEEEHWCCKDSGGLYTCEKAPTVASSSGKNKKEDGMMVAGGMNALLAAAALCPS